MESNSGQVPIPTPPSCVTPWKASSRPDSNAEGAQDGFVNLGSHYYNRKNGKGRKVDKTIRLKAARIAFIFALNRFCAMELRNYEKNLLESGMMDASMVNALGLRGWS